MKLHLGRKLKVARVAKGLSQDELAEKIGRTRPLISHIEVTGKVSAFTLNKICRALGITPDELENSLAEKPAGFQGQSEKNLRKEIERLKEEISLLRDLADSQKEIIRGLKEKLERKKKPKSQT